MEFVQSERGKMKLIYDVYIYVKQNRTGKYYFILWLRNGAMATVELS